MPDAEASSGRHPSGTPSEHAMRATEPLEFLDHARSREDSPAVSSHVPRMYPRATFGDTNTVYSPVRGGSVQEGVEKTKAAEKLSFMKEPEG